MTWISTQLDDIEIVVGVFVFYWVIDLAARSIWPRLLPAELFRLDHGKTSMILGRHTMDAVAAAMFIYLGWLCFQDAEFKALSEVSPMERTYKRHSLCHMLILTQIAYQAKNTIDSVICGDGIVFLLHHIGTGILCVFGTSGFLHSFAPFFLGYVEISTGFLCILACFDDAHGVSGLGKMYPKTKMVLAVGFASTFIPIRCVIWPYLSYFLWQDMLTVLEIGPPSAVAVYYALTTNAGLTVLQFYWLAEIIVTAKNEVLPELTASRPQPPPTVKPSPPTTASQRPPTNAKPRTSSPAAVNRRQPPSQGTKSEDSKAD